MASRVDISVVIPAFNEAKRLPRFLGELLDYCQASRKVYEIIVVDDGSKDETSRLASRFKLTFPGLLVHRLEKNRGKGYAVKMGLLRARGDVCLFMDADGSTPPQEIEKNLPYLAEGYDIFVGSRLLRGKDQVLRIAFHRRAIGVVFNFLVRRILFKDIQDTQCGFKMFRRQTIEPLFSEMRIDRFGFDLEILFLAHKLGFRIKEGPVSWRHVKGSKINLVLDSARMFVNMLEIRCRHGRLRPGKTLEPGSGESPAHWRETR